MVPDLHGVFNSPAIHIRQWCLSVHMKSGKHGSSFLIRLASFAPCMHKFTSSLYLIMIQENDWTYHRHHCKWLSNGGWQCTQGSSIIGSHTGDGPPMVINHHISYDLIMLYKASQYSGMLTQIHNSYIIMAWSFLEPFSKPQFWRTSLIASLFRILLTIVSLLIHLWTWWIC